MPLSARPLTVPAGLIEASPFTLSTFNAGDITTGFSVLDVRGGITDRIEVRTLASVHISVVPRRDGATEVAVGAGLAGIGVSNLDGVIFQPAANAELKHHLRADLALLAAVRYQLTVATARSDRAHGVAPSVDLQWDIVPRATLLVRLGYWFIDQQATTTRPDRTQHQLRLLAGLSVAPFHWLDLEAAIGPLATYDHTGLWSLLGTFQITARFHW